MNTLLVTELNVKDMKNKTIKTIEKEDLKLSRTDNSINSGDTITHRIEHSEICVLITNKYFKILKYRREVPSSFYKEGGIYSISNFGDFITSSEPKKIGDNHGRIS